MGVLAHYQLRLRICEWLLLGWGMVSFLRFALIILVLVSSSMALADVGSELSVCDAYLNKERELGCTKRNYLVRFGFKYCRAFVEQNDRFTEHGQMVTRQIRECLVRELETNEKMVCRNALVLSVKAHVGCYVDSGFCDLGFLDQWIILENIWPELLNKRMRNSSLEILRLCLAN